MDGRDKELLTILQFRFPLTVQPFRSMGRMLGCTEKEIISRIRTLKENGVVRQISPIFDSAKIGYQSTLAAFKVEPQRIEQVAQVLNQHPGVSHNYLRKGDMNLWFTLTLPRKKNLKDEIAAIAQKEKVKQWLFLPTEKTYKISFRLDMAKKSGAAFAMPLKRKKKTSSPAGLKISKQFIRITQHDMPLKSRPYAAAAKALGMREGDIISLLKKYQQCGYIRRVAAVLRPVKAGYKTNVMVAWKAGTAAEKELLGVCAAKKKIISHCYQRPVSRFWPYSIYTMIHGNTMSQCRTVIRSIVKESGISDYRELKTMKEFKKVRVLYYDE